MTAPYEKAKLAGYTVEESGGLWFANDPAGDTIAEGRKTEADAWEACDNHRMFGSIQPAQAVRLDTRRVLCASTAHLTLATCRMLSETPLERWPVYGGPMPDGFYVSASCRLENPNAPADLLDVMAHAQALGFDYVQFDTDADQLEGLPVYDHDPRPPVDALEAFTKVRRLFDTWDGWKAWSADYDPSELLAAIAEAVGAELNDKAAAPVAEDVRAKCARYNDALAEMGVSPNGDDYNALLDFTDGHPYRPPHEGDR